MTEHPNFGDLFWRAAALYPGKIAIEQGELALTYAELEERTERTAALLARLGIGAGDRVLLMFSNDYRFIECLLGTMRAGAVAVPANVRLGADSLAYIAAHSEASVVIAHAELADRVQAVRSAAPNVRHTLIVDGAVDGAESYDELLAGTPPGFSTVEVNASDVALQMYTSGSTGRPKGCLLSHANKWWQARSTSRTLLHEAHEKALVMGPLYHANALWACMFPMLYVGGGLVILPGFDAVAVIEAIDRYRPTYTSGTPSMYALMLAQRETLARCDVSSIELLACGSAPVPEELMRAVKERFNCEVVETYGLTEGGATVTTPRWGIKKLGSCGLPVPEAAIRIASLEDPAHDCPPGVVGELWTRSPANALGYFKQPEVTVEKFTADGWLRTGDLVKSDDQGYVFFCGRIDDMISVGGENVYPKEVETILLTHPAVADVCVVAVNHRVKGEAPVAWVVLHDDAIASEDELKQYFLARGAAYAHPRRVFFIDRLPVSSTNKLDRKQLENDAREQLPDGIAGGA